MQASLYAVEQISVARKMVAPLVTEYQTIHFIKIPNRKAVKKQIQEGSEIFAQIRIPMSVISYLMWRTRTIKNSLISKKKNVIIFA